MPPLLALFVTLILVLWLLFKDTRHSQGTSAGLWLPTIWLSIISSRYVSEWLTPGAEGDYLHEGSPIDQPIFLTLIAAAGWTVARRKIQWSGLASGNLILIAYLAYGGLSVSWSDFPFIAFKRWIKVLGHLLMVLIVYSEPEPKEAIRALFRRVGYLLIPTSVLLIKYFPDYGRSFSEWTGAAFNTGVTTNKNSLGVLTLMIGIAFVWDTFVRRPGISQALRRHELWAGGLILVMTAWLLGQANSATSSVSLFAALGSMLILGNRRLRNRNLGLYLFLGVSFLLLVDWLFGATEAVIQALGRDPTLTDRTHLWDDVLSIRINPLVGAGFESFWLGERVRQLWSKWLWMPNQAHNGYIETYLNGGWIGVLLLAGALISTYRVAKSALSEDPRFGRFCMSCLLAIVVYNYTEASCKVLHPLFFLFFLITVNFRGPLVAPSIVGSVTQKAATSAWRAKKSSGRVAHVTYPGRSVPSRPSTTRTWRNGACRRGKQPTMEANPMQERS
jgi:exopolysaccharide production protein ExoQ